MRKGKDAVLNTLLILSSLITIIISVVVIGYIFINGFSSLSFDFIFGNYRPGGEGGILPIILTTLMTVVIALIIAVPIGIGGAIYLIEYAKPGKLLDIIRFATDSLAGIPSIIYGLFGMTFFVTVLKMGFSVLAGSLTLAIIALPVIISTTEEALLSVPSGYREGAVGLGATKIEVISKIIIPSAIPGIVSGVLLSLGRIIGESAALILTLGTVGALPKSLLSSGRTLSVHAYLLVKEAGEIDKACAVGIVLIVIILALNITAACISKKISRKYS